MYIMENITNSREEHIYVYCVYCSRDIYSQRYRPLLLGRQQLWSISIQIQIHVCTQCTQTSITEASFRLEVPAVLILGWRTLGLERIEGTSKRKPIYTLLGVNLLSPFIIYTMNQIIHCVCIDRLYLLTTLTGLIIFRLSTPVRVVPERNKPGCDVESFSNCISNDLICKIVQCKLEL